MDQGKTLFNYAMKNGSERLTIMPTFSFVQDDFGGTRRIVTRLKLLRLFTSFMPTEQTFYFNDDGVCYEMVNEAHYVEGETTITRHPFVTIEQAKGLILSIC